MNSLSLNLRLLPIRRRHRVVWCVVYSVCVHVCADAQRGASVRVARQRRVVLAPVLRRTTVLLLVALPLRDLLGLRLVVVGPEAFALARGDHADFVSPSVAVGTLQLHPPRPGVSRDAAVVRGVTPPPLAASDGVRQEVRGHALARAHQLLDGFGAAARSVGDITGGTQLPTAQLRGTWVGEQDITVTLMASDQNTHFEAPRAGTDFISKKQVNRFNAAAASLSQRRLTYSSEPRALL